MSNNKANLNKSFAANAHKCNFCHRKLASQYIAPKQREPLDNLCYREFQHKEDLASCLIHQRKHICYYCRRELATKYVAPEERNKYDNFCYREFQKDDDLSSCRIIFYRYKQNETDIEIAKGHAQIGKTQFPAEISPFDFKVGAEATNQAIPKSHPYLDSRYFYGGMDNDKESFSPGDNPESLKDFELRFTPAPQKTLENQPAPSFTPTLTPK